jgi:hypothetical protein
VPDVVILPGQGRLLGCAADHVLFVAGVASGKTEGGARWALQQIIEQPQAVGFVGAQSYAQLARVSLPALLRLLGAVGLPFVFNKRPPDSWGPSRFPEHERILSIQLPGVDQPCQIITGTMENPDAHRGIAVGWAWLDESRDMKAEAFDVILSRLRGQPVGTRYRTLNTTTPNGFGWLHERFVSSPVPRSAIVRAATTENPYLPPGFVDTLRAQYTERFARQEIDGEFLNLTAGQAYHAFRRDPHVAAVTVNPRLPLWYAMDFNVSPLCACYGQHDSRGSMVAGEVFIQGSGRTADAAEEFTRRNARHENKSVVVFGDMSGAARSTRSDQTDYDVIAATMAKAGWSVEIRRNYVNPPLVASVEAVNAHLEKGRGRIDPSCKVLIRDLEQVAWEEGTRVIAKGNADLTHMSDAYRYFVFREFDTSQRAGWSNALN